MEAKKFFRRAAPVFLAGGVLFGAEACASSTATTPAPRVEPSGAPTMDPLVQIDQDLKAILEGQKAAANTAVISPMPSASVEAITSAENLPAWPSSAKEAASLFGTDAQSKDPKRWEKTADQGGWHFIEAATVSGLNPSGYILEGYYDTKPGKNPACFVSNGLPVGVQGATVWNVSGVEEASKLLNKMALPKWDDGKVHPCTAVGFTPTK